MRFTEEVWNVVDAALLKLDQRLQQDDKATYDDLVPEPENRCRLVVLAELVKLHQEYAWKAGRRPLLETYLTAWPELRDDTGVMAGLLRAECQTRMYHGEPIDHRELECRFPDICDHVGVDGVLASDAYHPTHTLSFNISTDDLASICSGEWYEDPQSLPKPLTPGTMLGRYSVLSVLGRGGMATVYLAQDEELDRVVAIKVLHRRFLAQLGADKDLLRRDARAAARLRHPAVVPVYDICADDSGQSFIVMEYVKGESLQRRMAREPLDVVDAVDIGSQVAAALAAAHRVGLIHRDVKPANILLDESGRVRVTDFGLAVRLHEREQWTGDCSGTLPYMAPEQVLGLVEQQDGRTDVWALGVVLYEMLTRKRPFEGDDREALGHSILGDPVESPREINRKVPSRVARLCLRCLEKEMEKRDIPAAALHKELEEAKLRLLRPSMVTRFVIASALMIALVVAAFFALREPSWSPPTRDVSKIPLHPWLADCKLAIVADTGATVDLAKVQAFIDLNHNALVPDGYIRFDSYYRDPVAKSVRIQGDWVLWEMPLAVSWSERYREHSGRSYRNESLAVAPDVAVRLRFAISRKGVFQFGTIGDRPEEHFALLLQSDGINNYRGFNRQIFELERIGAPLDHILELNDRQNHLANIVANVYRHLQLNGAISFGPTDFFQLYQCPLEVRNYFDFPLTVVSTRMVHEQFDYEFPRAQRFIREAWNRKWSPIAEHPDQDADLEIAVELEASSDVPSLLLVDPGCDNENEASFRVEGLKLEQTDLLVQQALAGEQLSHIRVSEERGVCTGGVNGVSRALVFLYGEAPTRIELHARTRESVIRSTWSYITAGKVEIRNVRVLPKPDGGRQIAPQIWVLPPRNKK